MKIFPFNLFFGDVLWKVCAQERYVGPFATEKKSRLTMKEGLNEVVRPDLSANCLQRSDSKSFQFFALDLCPDSEKPTNARVPEDGCFSSPTPRRFRQSAVQSNRLLFLVLGRFFLETTLLSREDGHETTTSEAPN